MSLILFHTSKHWFWEEVTRKQKWICKNTDTKALHNVYESEAHPFLWPSPLCLSISTAASLVNTWMPMERHLPFLSASFLYSSQWSSTTGLLLKTEGVGVLTVMVLLLTCWLAGPWTYIGTTDIKYIVIYNIQKSNPPPPQCFHKIGKSFWVAITLQTVYRTEQMLICTWPTIPFTKEEKKHKSTHLCISSFYGSCQCLHAINALCWVTEPWLNGHVTSGSFLFHVCILVSFRKQRTSLLRQIIMSINITKDTLWNLKLLCWDVS